MEMPREGNKARKGRQPVWLVAALVAGGFMACSAAKDTAELPGLQDLRATGLAGKRCYESCTYKDMNCSTMCPPSSEECREECTAHTKLCLSRCPELVPVSR